MEVNPLPSADINIKNFKVNGHELDFKGRLKMAFRTNNKKQLVAFEGHECSEVTVDGIAYKFSEHPLETVVPRKQLERTENQFIVDFKWSENPAGLVDSISFCTRGNTAPN